MKISLVTLAAAMSLALVACSGGVDDAGTAESAATLQLPQKVVGLQIEAEKVGSGLKKVERPYVDTVAVFSLREKDLLRASLQVNRFNSAARAEDSDFRESIVATIGGTAPVRLRIDEQPVFATSASEQTVFTWFAGNGMFVLAVQREFEFPRTLVRRLVSLDLSL